jgi:hypothetical protein
MNSTLIIVIILILIFFSLLTLLILLILDSKKRSRRKEKRIVYSGNGLELIFDRDSMNIGRYKFDHDKGTFNATLNSDASIIVQLHPEDDYTSIAEIKLTPVSFDHDDQFNTLVLFSNCCFPKLKAGQSFRMTRSTKEVSE